MKISAILFKFITKSQVFFYRLTNGKVGGTLGGLSLLLLTTVGRKTGRKRTVIISYIRDGKSYVITASAGGSDRNPAWFWNLKDNPSAEIQVKNKKIEVNAKVAEQNKRNQYWKRLIKVAPGFKAYQKKTKRLIPMVILQPQD
ncbi:nitroreductase family deazaflavin-dependent oxidoreductase [Patescibacteria group bacterium]|nr:nitroreductase family deazaflavin-dependent oxidoreductase [Patescibacteria group bacterium]